MTIHLTQDEYRSLIMGEYRLTPCICEMGTIYVDGYIGEEVSLQTYRKLQEDPEYNSHLYLYELTCEECHGVGKKVWFDD